MLVQPEDNEKCEKCRLNILMPKYIRLSSSVHGENEYNIDRQNKKKFKYRPTFRDEKADSVKNGRLATS